MGVAAEIVEKAKNGDSNAWTEMYMATYSIAFGVAMQLIKNRDTVEDILQDSYISAYTKLNTLQDTDKFQHWFNRIVANNCKNYLVKKKPELFSEKATVNDDGDIVEFDIIDEREDFKPDSKIFTDEINALFYKMLDKLPKEQQICVLMCWVQDLTCAETAEILGVSENTVKSRLHYAKEKLTADAEQMKKDGVTVFSVDGFAFIPFMRWLFSRASEVVDEDKATDIIRLCKANQQAGSRSGFQKILHNSVERNKILSIIASFVVVIFIASLFVPHIRHKMVYNDNSTTEVMGTTLLNIEDTTYSESSTIEEISSKATESTTLGNSLTSEQDTTNTTTQTTITTTTTTAVSTTEKTYLKDLTVTTLGINKYPYFKLDNMIAFCADISAKVPETGILYYEIDNPVDYYACNKTFIAMSLANRSDAEFYQVIQQMVWGDLNGFKPDASIRKISDTAYSIYEELLSIIDGIDENDYEVYYRSFITDEVPASGNEYQRLINATVKKR